jgi:hypothetical protein
MDMVVDVVMVDGTALVTTASPATTAVSLIVAATPTDTALHELQLVNTATRAAVDMAMVSMAMAMAVLMKAATGTKTVAEGVVKISDLLVGWLISAKSPHPFLLRKGKQGSYLHRTAVLRAIFLRAVLILMLRAMMVAIKIMMMRLITALFARMVTELARLRGSCRRARSLLLDSGSSVHSLSASSAELQVEAKDVTALHTSNGAIKVTSVGDVLVGGVTVADSHVSLERDTRLPDALPVSVGRIAVNTGFKVLFDDEAALVLQCVYYDPADIITTAPMDKAT